MDIVKYTVQKKMKWTQFGQRHIFKLKNLFSYLKFMGKKESQDETRGVLVTKMK